MALKIYFFKFISSFLSIRTSYFLEFNKKNPVFILLRVILTANNNKCVASHTVKCDIF